MHEDFSEVSEKRLLPGSESTAKKNKAELSVYPPY